MMTRALRFANLLAVAVVAVSAHAATAQTIRFTVADATPALTIRVLTSPDDTTPSLLARKADGSWEFYVQRRSGDWRTEPTFLVDVPARTVETDGVSSDAMTLELDFSFPADEVDQTIEVPIALFRNPSLKERNRIDAMQPHDQFEKILAAQSLALHYLGRLPSPQDALTRWMTRIWFETLFAATEHQHRPLRIGNLLASTMAKVFADDQDSLSHFAGAQAQVRQATWQDKDKLPDLLAGDRKRCDEARSLVTYLTAFHRANPEDATAERLPDPDNVLTAMSASVANSCDARP